VSGLEATGAVVAAYVDLASAAEEGDGEVFGGGFDVLLVAGDGGEAEARVACLRIGEGVAQREREREREKCMSNWMRSIIFQRLRSSKNGVHRQREPAATILLLIQLQQPTRHWKVALHELPSPTILHNAERRTSVFGGSQ
jgi:hypothetical protein